MFGVGTFGVLGQRPQIVGGTVTSLSYGGRTYRLHSFGTGSGTLVYHRGNLPTTSSFQLGYYLAVASGGGGGGYYKWGSSDRSRGGGGAGGMLNGVLTTGLSPGTLSYSVGAPKNYTTGRSNDTTLTGLATVQGGGMGGTAASFDGQPGGSGGGGGSWPPMAGGAGVSGQGNSGSGGSSSDSTGRQGGGGGGKASAGTLYVGGNGTTWIDGVGYCGGGAGGKGISGGSPTVTGLYGGNAFTGGGGGLNGGYQSTGGPGVIRIATVVS